MADNNRHDAHYDEAVRPGRLGLFSVIDRYIIVKFLGAFLFITALFLMICVVIDLSERLETLIDRKIGFWEAITDYYIGFVPWIGSLLAPFFVFLAVIYIASRMTYASEMVSIIGNGISFWRMLFPFVATAALLATMLWFANNWLVPSATKIRIDFEDTYVHSWRTNYNYVEFTVDKRPGYEQIASMQRYNTDRQEGTQFSLKTIEEHNVTEFIQAVRVTWMEDSERWSLNNYELWTIDGNDQILHKGAKLDTVLGFGPNDLIFTVDVKETMSTPELNRFIEEQRQRGSEKIPFYLVAKYQRTSNAFAVIILALMGVAVSMRRARAGLGFQIAFGIAMSAIFFLTLRFSTTFATNAGLHPIIACWLPNIFFGIAAFFMLRAAPK